MIEVKNIKASKEKNIDAIYIHIPFCDKKCEYCDFCTFVRMEKEYKKYTDYLIKEIRMYPKIKYDTIYFGGGTPSLLPVAMISEILDELDWSENAEITLELNPTDVTFEKLKKLNKIGINRLSIGIQSFQDHVLKFIGRQHSSDDAINVYKMARKAGFSNITVDLMFGIPNQSLEDLQRDLDILRELKPENVSIYSLIWEEGTVFWSKLQKGILSEIDQDLEAEMYEKIIDFFWENGYCQYEISNFARIDDEDKDVEINEIKKFKERYNGKKIFYIVIVTAKKGLEKINIYSKDNNLLINLLPKFTQEKIFEQNLFDNNESAKQLLIRLSEEFKIPKFERLGYDKSESLVAFYNNTPNNTIGLMRYDTDIYKSLFPRKNDKKPLWKTMKKDEKERKMTNYNNKVEKGKKYE